jgi:GDP-D-mannose dehydratase
LSRVAFVTGITGQDGSYLAEFLLAKGYEVHGLIRRASTFNTGRIDHVYQDPHDPGRRLFLHYGDLTDGSMLARLLAEIRPDELYNLESHVGVSFDMPEYTANVTALGALRFPFFNHESPRRGETFVTRKVTRAVARIVAGKERKVYLGNLDARRDWGYAPEYVEAMWQMLQMDGPGDFVLATGEAHTVRELCQVAFDLVGLDWCEHVEVDARYLRPKDVALLVGDASRAQKELGWEPKVRFRELVQIMLQADLEREGIEPANVLTVPPLPTRPEWAERP